MPLLEPDRYFSRISQIDLASDLMDRGIANVLLDIDNTILSRTTHDIPRDVGAWLARARDAGISFCLVSNNWHRSALAVAERLELPIVAKSMKPLPFALRSALRLLGATRQDSVCIGDQIMTDVLGAHLVGIEAYLVVPLVEADLKHTLLLRNLERVLLGTREPERRQPVPEMVLPAQGDPSAKESEPAH